MKKLITICFVAAIFAVADAYAATITIDFDDVTAPIVFIQTTRLTEHYASLGVHFCGPADSNGGAILSQGSNFGVDDLSGSNFLAFNRYALLSDDGVPTDPETILFDNLMADVSIYAAGGNKEGPTQDTGIFTMQAYDVDGYLVDSSTITTTTWEPLSVHWSAGIRKVVLEESGDDYAFVYDNLSFTPVPEPATICMLGLGALSLIRRKR